MVASGSDQQTIADIRVVRRAGSLQAEHDGVYVPVMITWRVVQLMVFALDMFSYCERHRLPVVAFGT